MLDNPAASQSSTAGIDEKRPNRHWRHQKIQQEYNSKNNRQNDNRIIIVAQEGQAKLRELIAQPQIRSNCSNCHAACDEKEYLQIRFVKSSFLLRLAQMAGKVRKAQAQNQG